MRLRLLTKLFLLTLACAATGVTRGAEPHTNFTAHQFGDGAKSYWLFEPSEPTPALAPVVVFNHGWLAVNPGVYGAWIEHLTQRGFIVIFPRYQASWVTPAAEFLPNAAAAINDALDVLVTAPGHVKPDRTRVAVIGHSAGGNLAAHLAASAADLGLPQPRAVIAVLPGEVRPIRDPALDRIPASTLLVVVVAEFDLVVGDYRARQIYREASAIPPERKIFVHYRGDRTGPAPLVADHTAPTAALARLDSGEGPLRGFQMSRAVVDRIDRLGFWRLADVTIDAAFAGRTLSAATDDGEAFRTLGRWPDGRLVTPPLVSSDPSSLPHIVPPHGIKIIPWEPAEIFRFVGGDKATAKTLVR